ncbi:MAG TPA: 50S ribosomal protein L21 [Candidatus Omnitrophica bacterium]|nr:50S ribosomal protein L21 [Candidatus Omnitrophota bacterium]
MYAIIDVGGKQEKVTVGDCITIDRISNKKDVTFSNVFLVSDGEKVEVGTPYVKGAKVLAAVLEQTRGPKVISFKYRRRKSSREKIGHRQDLTRVKITDIALA